MYLELLYSSIAQAELYTVELGLRRNDSPVSSAKPANGFIPESQNLIISAKKLPHTIELDIAQLPPSSSGTATVWSLEIISEEPHTHSLQIGIGQAYSGKEPHTYSLQLCIGARGLLW